MSETNKFITVTELNNSIKNTLFNTYKNIINLRGEISNIKISGENTYLNLKDQNSSINIVAWGVKFNNLKNGDEVIAIGTLTSYIKTGSYQLRVTKIEKIGLGILNEEYEKNKKKFDKKGFFFKSKNDVPIPNKIKRIGILTSTEGAALQDILYVLKKNYFCGEVLIKNCSVQGMHCPKSVSEGINYFNKIHEKKYVDVLIIARGGGSFEDLIGYSSKEIVKSIYKSNIYIISAIGHEVDNMLSDFSANLRAPTPSIAGELLSASKKKEIDLISTGKDNLAIIKMKINNILSSYKEKINSSKKILNAFNPTSFINLEKDKLLKIKINIFNKIKSNLFNIITKIEKYTAKNNSYSPNKIFENGYVAIVDKNNNLINKLDNFKQCKKLKIIFIDGEFELNINK